MVPARALLRKRSVATVAEPLQEPSGSSGEESSLSAFVSPHTACSYSLIARRTGVALERRRLSAWTLCRWERIAGARDGLCPREAPAGSSEPGQAVARCRSTRTALEPGPRPGAGALALALAHLASSRPAIHSTIGAGSTEGGGERLSLGSSLAVIASWWARCPTLGLMLAVAARMKYRSPTSASQSTCWLALTRAVSLAALPGLHSGMRAGSCARIWRRTPGTWPALERRRGVPGATP